MSNNKQTFHSDLTSSPGHSRESRTRSEPPITDSITKQEFDSKYYQIKSGLALVLNNIKFRVPGEDLGDRHGSDIDASTITQRFAELGFEYELESNLSQSATIDWFNRVKRQLVTKPVDCFILVILSRGTEDGVYATDQFMRTEDIVEPFNATNCKALRFKPKIVILQQTKGINIVSNDGCVAINKTDAMGYDNAVYDNWCGIGQLDKQICNLPNEADFLFACATVPGAGAFRKAEEGTPFIRHLAKAIVEMEVNEDFYSVLTSVNKMVGMTFKPNGGEAEYTNVVQMPCFVSHLTKILRLKQLG